MGQKETNKIVVFGCCLDCDERYDAVQEKIQVASRGLVPDDPYYWIVELLAEDVSQGIVEARGSIEVEPWLRPVPPSEALHHVTVENFVKFIDEENSLYYINRVEQWVSSIYPQVPCLIGVDHSLTMGAVSALARKVGTDNITLIVLDSHTDAIPMSILSDLISYDIDTNPSTVFDQTDPFLKNRPDSCNSSTFLDRILANNLVRPENLVLLGICDEPPKRSFRIKDARVKQFVQFFLNMKRKGIKLLPKKEILRSPSKLKAILHSIKTPYVYLSIDMDIGARNALNGVRFLNRQGINEKQIYSILDHIENIVLESVELIGFDVMEFNPRKANSEFSQGKDRTYEIAKNIVHRLAVYLHDKEHAE